MICHGGTWNNDTKQFECEHNHLKSEHYNCEAMRIASMPGGGTTIGEVHDAIERHVNQQIKSVLDSIPEPTITDVFPSKPYDGTKTYEDMLQVVKYYKSTIQKIRSRYE